MNRVSLLLPVLVAGCSSISDPPRPPEELTALPRALTADEQHVATASNQFALTLFRQLNAAQPGENVFVSPLSVGFSLGMTMNGAAGTTLDEMRSTLGFGSADMAAINAGYRGLMGLERGLDASTTFTIANSVWHRQSFPVLQSFTDQVKATFDADVRASPFDNTTLAQVNQWVNEKTNGKIPTILDAIEDQNVMFLINAIYFKGSWRAAFDRAKTQDAGFAALSGTQTVRMMQREKTAIRLGGNAGFVIGEMPYGNGAFVMTVIVPNGTAAISDVAAALDTASWNAAVNGMRETEAMVRFPRLRLEYKRELKDDLKILGMRVPFAGSIANFSKLTPTPDGVYIDFVMHKTFVDVNEEGTEAAAVTNTGISVTSAGPCLCVDRPFVLAIRERFSGTILFIGKIVRVP